MEKCSACFESSGLGLGLGLLSSNLGLVTRGLVNITDYNIQVKHPATTFIPVGVLRFSELNFRLEVFDLKRFICRPDSSVWDHHCIVSF